MDSRVLYQKELLKLRKTGLSTNYIDLKVEKRNKGYNFIIHIEERMFNNRITHFLNENGYQRNPRFETKSVSLNVKDIINLQARGKVITNFNKNINYIVFERFVSFLDS